MLIDSLSEEILLYYIIKYQHIKVTLKRPLEIRNICLKN